MHLGHSLTNHLGQADQLLAAVLLAQPGVNVLLGGDPSGDVFHHDGAGHTVTEVHCRGGHSDLFTLQQGSCLGLVSVLGQLSIQGRMSGARISIHDLYVFIYL